MSSAENVAAGARAVFFSVAYPDPSDGYGVADAGRVFDQLGALFRAARAVADPQWLGSRAEALEAAGGAAGDDDERFAAPTMSAAQQPLVRRVHMDWRHMEVVTQLPWEFIVGGGLVGLVTIVEAVADAPPGIAVRLAQLSAEQTDWKQRRTEPELAVIAQLASAIAADAASRPARSRLYLGEEDELEAWTA